MKEQNAIKTLLNDATVVIRPADKGSGVMVVDTNTYITEMEKEMEMCDSYEITDGSGQCNAEKAVKRQQTASTKMGTFVTNSGTTSFQKIQQKQN